MIDGEPPLELSAMAAVMADSHQPLLLQGRIRLDGACWTERQRDREDVSDTGLVFRFSSVAALRLPVGSDEAGHVTAARNVQSAAHLGATLSPAGPTDATL